VERCVSFRVNDGGTQQRVAAKSRRRLGVEVGTQGGGTV
jgi:hypothetical protein